MEHRLIVTTFPRAVRVIEHTLIPLKDGTTLAARIWLPEDAERNPVPAILEYLPYRKRDGTYERDALTHPYLAGNGYAGVRVDIRGSGESSGLLFDEYSEQEQRDALEVIAWLAAQPWCSGAVGMMGISWGGFNGLQIAARRPPALKAIVTLCSTDDRYRDDRCGRSGSKACRCSWRRGCDISDATPIGDRARCARTMMPSNVRCTRSVAGLMGTRMRFRASLRD
jgi:putative CocE/NonD family hydrolase